MAMSSHPCLPAAHRSSISSPLRTCSFRRIFRYCHSTVRLLLNGQPHMKWAQAKLRLRFVQLSSPANYMGARMPERHRWRKSSDAWLPGELLRKRLDLTPQRGVLERTPPLQGSQPRKTALAVSISAAGLESADPHGASARS